MALGFHLPCAGLEVPCSGIEVRSEASSGLAINVFSGVYCSPGCSHRQQGREITTDGLASLSEMASFQRGLKWFSSPCEYRTCQMSNKVGSEIKFSMTQNKITASYCLWGLRGLRRIPPGWTWWLVGLKVAVSVTQAPSLPWSFTTREDSPRICLIRC